MKKMFSVVLCFSFIFCLSACSYNPPEGYTEEHHTYEEILEFANKINMVNTERTNETIGTNENYNVFRKDEVVQFENKETLLQNAPSKDEGMFRIPKVLNSNEMIVKKSQSVLNLIIKKPVTKLALLVCTGFHSR